MTNETHRYRLPLDLQLFAEDPEPNPDHADPEPEPEKTFTQAELDEIVAKRLARDRKGREDYDDIKAKLEALEQAEAERERAKLTETERLEAEKQAALDAAEAAKTERDNALSAANTRLINAEFKALARDANIPADRLAAALKLADLSVVTVDDEGNVVGADAAVKALIEENPYLVAQTKPKSIGDGTPIPAGEDERRTLEAQLAEARKERNFTKVIELSNKLSK
ncbi:scaffolding protein [Paenibacillus motobuensis]|uniref:phage scaffolding protein n=1 Tax=Paenibacillus motobuensis TaxID=295324 RepID=UPI00363DB15D